MGLQAATQEGIMRIFKKKKCCGDPVGVKRISERKQEKMSGKSTLLSSSVCVDGGHQLVYC